MKRLPRILLNVVTVVSLVLCVATVVLWVRSYFVCDIVAQSDLVDHVWCASSNRGEFHFDHFDGPTVELAAAGCGILKAGGWSWDKGPVQAPADLDRTDATIDYRIAWFGLVGSDLGDGDRLFQGLLPAWLLVIVFAALPVVRLVARLRPLRRHGRGLCPSCGYDLRATPDRCPECGTVPKGVGA